MIKIVNGEYIEMTNEEVEARQAEILAHQEEELLSTLIPSDSEVSQAEFELNVITLLAELGVLEIVEVSVE
jgi:hypothetical protein